MDKRKFIDCRECPSDIDCTVRISGRENEVLPLAVHHAMTVHSHEDTPELREQLTALLKDE
jgi:hypothetical protein